MDKRRSTDPMIERMEEDIKDLKKDYRELSKNIGEIREKIFNGFDASVQEIRHEVKILSKLNSRLGNVEKSLLPEERLKACPLKEEVFKRVERRLYIAIAIFSVFLTVLTFWRG